MWIVMESGKTITLADFKALYHNDYSYGLKAEN